MPGWLKKLFTKGDGSKSTSEHSLPDSELTAEDLLYRQTAHHGPIDGAVCLAHDSVLGLAAIGGEGGCVKVESLINLGDGDDLFKCTNT
jgi:hypothetical protein